VRHFQNLTNEVKFQTSRFLEPLLSQAPGAAEERLSPLLFRRAERVNR
jgi:hypothetical protein